MKKKVFMSRCIEDGPKWEEYTKEEQEQPLNYDAFEVGKVYRYEYMVIEIETEEEK